MLLLDGMPCDRGRWTLAQGSEEEVIWEYDPSQHPLCDSIGEIENPFALLREALMRGMLADTALQLELMGGTKYKICRGK